MLICKNDATRQSTMAKKTQTNQRKYMQITDLQTNLSKYETSQTQQKKLDKVNQIKLNKVMSILVCRPKKREPAMNLVCVNKEVVAYRTCKTTNHVSLINVAKKNN